MLNVPPCDIGDLASANGYENVNTVLMRRALVLSHEKSRHPFRASLPAHVFEKLREISDILDVDLDDNACGEPQLEPEVLAANEIAELRNGVATDPAKTSWWHLTRTDVRGFVSTYFATLMAALVFIM